MQSASCATLILLLEYCSIETTNYTPRRYYSLLIRDKNIWLILLSIAEELFHTSPCNLCSGIAGLLNMGIDELQSTIYRYLFTYFCKKQ